MGMKPLLVGESNPYGPDPQYAFYPYPESSAGYRLCTKIMGLKRREYLEKFDRVNLCARRWNIKEAREHANRIARERRPMLVLFGSKVSQAFGLDFTPFQRIGGIDGLSPVLILPHPSGLSRYWNEPDSFERARSVLRDAGVLEKSHDNP